MELSRQEYKRLLQQYIAGNISEDDETALLKSLENQQQSAFWESILKEMHNEISFTLPYTSSQWEPVLQIVLDNKPARSSFIRRMRWVAAAILILAIGSGVYYFSNQSSKLPANIGGTGGTVGTRGDIAPGRNRAVLTINNKQNIDLSSDKTGININSSITYNDGEKIADAGQMLQLTTPRGGQYQAVLPDGSRVWLNAASSIKFPSKFSDIERRVEITGEAYFEITKDGNKPFFVQTLKDNIVVLGTSFNINNYPDDAGAKISLIEGSIKVNNKILKPGEAYQNGKNIKTNIEQDIAWKNGFFNLQDVTLEQAMKQLERWYDIQVKYEGPIPQIQFKGEMDRNLPLSGVLNFFTGFGINIHQEGKILIIKP